jgi:hypothetical protein
MRSGKAAAAAIKKEEVRIKNPPSQARYGVPRGTEN